MFAPKNHDSSGKGFSKVPLMSGTQNYTSWGKKQSFSVEKIVQGAEHFVQILPVLAGVMRHWGWNTALEKPVAKLSFTSTKHHPLHLQTKPQVASIISIYWELGKRLALFWGAAESSAPQQQWASCSHPMPQLRFSSQPRQMPPRPKERSLTH